jgi:hypothetical protein
LGLQDSKSDQEKPFNIGTLVPEEDPNRALRLDLLGIGRLAYEMFTEEEFTEESLEKIALFSDESEIEN